MLRIRIPSFGRNNTALALLRKSVSPRYVSAEHCLSNTPTKDALIVRKDRHPRTCLLQAIHAGVKATDDHEKITSLVDKNLDRFMPRITQPQNSYETVIRFLLSRNCIPAAVSVYERMTEVGYAVSLRLEARMLVYLMVKTFGVEEKVLEEMWESFLGVVRKEGFTDGDLWNVLMVMGDHEYPADLLLTTMNTFYETHESKGSVPDVRLYKRFLHRGTEKGLVEDGLRSLGVLGHSRIRGPRRRLVNQAFAAFIAGVRDASYPEREVIGSALKLMEEQGVQPNIVVVNSLISLEVRRGSLHRAFALYRSVKRDRRLWPDDFTFGSLFNVLNRLYKEKRRRVRHGRLVAGDIPSPRTLFREMMEALLWKRTGLAFEPTTSLMNVVLRSFVYKTDYVGAVVALQCFTAFGVTPNVVTYKLVLTHLMNRISYWIRAYRKMGDDTWADRFLTLPYPVLDPAFLANLQLGNPLMMRILDVCRRRDFNLGWPLFAHKWQDDYRDVLVEYKVPSLEYILGRCPVSLEYAFDVVPLERLLRKAILCEVGSMRELGYGEAADGYISRVIGKAKVEMVPVELEERLEEMERQRMVMESEKACMQMFEGFTERRKRRKAQRGGDRVVVEVGKGDKGAGEGEKGAELPDGVVDETQVDAGGEHKAPEVTLMVLDGAGTRIWTNQEPQKRKRRKEPRRTGGGAGGGAGEAGG